MSQIHSLNHKAFSTISPLLVDQFGRSLRFCYLEFVKIAISDDFSSENPGMGATF